MPADRSGELTKIVEWLRAYPLKETPYPAGYPDDLRFEHYPGKDFVVGMCEEAVDNYMDTYIAATNPIVKDIAKMGMEIFKKVKLERLRKLQQTTQTVYKKTELQQMIEALL